MILSACSAREEEEWRSLLQQRAVVANQDLEDGNAAEFEICSISMLDLKPIGNVFGQPGTLARRISVQRAATLGIRSDTCQVIIKNTHALKDVGKSPLPASPSMNRSQSLLSTNRIPVLAPKRSDRARLEHALGDVWTREVLPYPGMGAVRTDHLIRVSANSMMRKLSMTGLATSFTRRSTSHAHLCAATIGDTAKDLEDVAERSDNADADTEATRKSSNAGKDTTMLSGVQTVRSPPRSSSSNSIKRFKGNRLIKKPKSTDPIRNPGTADVPVSKAASEDGRATGRLKTKWNNLLAWSKIPHPITYGSCLGEQT